MGQVHLLSCSGQLKRPMSKVFTLLREIQEVVVVAKLWPQTCNNKYLAAKIPPPPNGKIVTPWWLGALIVEIEVHPSPVLATFRSFDYFFKPCFALEIYWCSHNPGRNNSERKNFLVDNPASITIFKITKKLSKLSIPAVSKPSARGNASNIVFLGIFPPDIVLVRRYIFSFTILGEVKISQIPHLCNIWQHRPIQFQIIQFHASHPKW